MSRIEPSAIETLCWNLESLSRGPMDSRPPQDIRALVRNTRELPPLPETGRRLLALLNRPDADAQSLARLVEADPLVATQMLRWANSAYYGLDRPVSSVRDAVTRVLGYEQAAGLALGLTALSPLQAPRDGLLGHRNVWKHGLLCSRAMLRLIPLLSAQHRPARGLVQLAGLIQNIGYLLLAHLLPAQFSFLRRVIAANPAIELPVTEHFALGLDHTQLGQWLMEAWDMPAPLHTAVGQHHNPGYAGDHQTLTLLTCLADRLTSRAPGGLGPAARPETLDHLMERLGVEREACLAALAGALNAGSDPG
jgi:HD-like signal output (HDOD) protein